MSSKTKQPAPRQPKQPRPAALPEGITKAVTDAGSPPSSVTPSTTGVPDPEPTMEQMQQAMQALQLSLQAMSEEKTYWANQCWAARAEVMQLRRQLEQLTPAP